ncbi:MAG: zinc ribbon domain-containing protein [Candidatus Lokiarchaeota archaeon]|nr:zinc ribbon domain-containing protein [Candidatus Lokiarchaeota archaeon]
MRSRSHKELTKEDIIDFINSVRDLKEKIKKKINLHRVKYDLSVDDFLPRPKSSLNQKNNQQYSKFKLSINDLFEEINLGNEKYSKNQLINGSSKKNLIFKNNTFSKIDKKLRSIKDPQDLDKLTDLENWLEKLRDDFSNNDNKISIKESQEYCISCGNRINKENIFCSVCGNKNNFLEIKPFKQKKCPYCNENIDSSAKYCNFCGSNLLKK